MELCQDNDVMQTITTQVRGSRVLGNNPSAVRFVL